MWVDALESRSTNSCSMPKYSVQSAHLVTFITTYLVGLEVEATHSLTPPLTHPPHTDGSTSTLPSSKLHAGPIRQHVRSPSPARALCSPDYLLILTLLSLSP